MTFEFTIARVRLAGRLVLSFAALLLGAGPIVVTTAVRAEDSATVNQAEARQADAAGNRVAFSLPSQESKALPLPVATAAASASQNQAVPLAEHPLRPVLRWAKSELPAIEAIRDYSARLVMRERVGNRLNNYQFLAIKIRHQPFSVYVDFLAPASLKGQRVIYVEGQNDGAMWVRRERMTRALSILPDSDLAMANRRYPITEIGIVNLVKRLIAVGEHDAQFGECEVKYITGAKVGDRTCTVVEVVHPYQRRDFTFHLARIYVDDALSLPIRFESYAWPQEPGGEPEPLEEYTYLDLKLNQGLGDIDFSPRNPAYGFTFGEARQ